MREVVDQVVEHVGVADEAEEVVVGAVGFFGQLVPRLVRDHVGLRDRAFGLVDGLLWLGRGAAEGDGGRHGGRVGWDGVVCVWRWRGEGWRE